MPIQGLPQFGVPGEILAEAPNQMLKNIMDRVKAEQDAKRLALEQEKQPLTLDYLRAQIQEHNLRSRGLQREISQKEMLDKIIQQSMNQPSMNQPSTFMQQPNAVNDQNVSPSGGYTNVNGNKNPMSSMTPINNSADVSSMLSPSMPNKQPLAQPESMAEDTKIVNAGSPNLYNIDNLFDSNPLARDYLEKNGFKKTQTVKIDNKTGKATIVTKYPSGKITMQTAGGSKPPEGTPLTSAMVTKHQQVISGADTVIPVLKKILALGGGEALDANGMPAGKNKDVFQPYPLMGWTPLSMGNIPGWMSDAADYESLVTSASEPLVKALGYPTTSEGLEKAIKQVQTTGGERNYRYIQRIIRLINELEERKAYSEKELERAATHGISTTEQPQYTSNDYEEV